MNICSMTGFGRAETVTDRYRISVELKSVNHRYLDLGIKLPRRMNCFEARLRQLIRTYIERGKTDLYILYEDYSDASKKLMYNKALAEEYLGYLDQMSKDFGLKNDVGTAALSRFPAVITVEESFEDDEKLWSALKPVVDEAAAAFCASREKEGGHLREDLTGKLRHMQELVQKIEDASPSVVDEYRKRLRAKIDESLAELGAAADEARIVTEVTIYADKICTDEEMVRLKSHIKKMLDKLEKGGSCGRELDFIAQEMNREANTTLSKAGSLAIADIAIELKTEVEKVREQVQNIE